MKKTMRRSRNRRGSRRPMRKNKTMRGGLWGYVTKDEFVSSGLRFAKDALLRYPLGVTWPDKFRKPREPNVVSEFAVGQYYTEFYNKKRPATVETYEYTKNNFMGNLNNQKRNKPVLTPDDFKEVYNYISNPESKGEDKNMGVSTSRNQKYIDFLASFLAFAQGDEQLKTMKPQATALQGEITARLAGNKVATTLQGFVSNPSVQQNLKDMAPQVQNLVKGATPGLTQLAKKAINNAPLPPAQKALLTSTTSLASTFGAKAVGLAMNNPKQAMGLVNTVAGLTNMAKSIPVNTRLP